MQKVSLGEFDNSWYRPGGKLKILLWYFVNEFIFNTGMIIPINIKIKLLKIFGAQVGTGVILKPRISIKYPWLLKIGDNTWIGENVWIDNLAEVFIGKNVCISQGAMLLTGNHSYKLRTFDLIIGKIEVHDGAWIGAKTIICPGTTVETHSVITVGSVLTRNTEPYGIYQGNPASFIKNRIIIK